MSKQVGLLPRRSPLLINPDDSALLIVDVQGKLLPHISMHQQVVWNIGRLMEGAKILDVEIRMTEQYPKGLGETIEDLRSLVPKPESNIVEKTMFSCRECSNLFTDLRALGIQKIVVTGIETHVCVAQTVMDIMADGFDVYLCVDAIGSRFELDHQTAIRRLENAGVTPTTTEAVLFEWCENSTHPQFKQISKLVQQKPGGSNH